MRVVGSLINEYKVVRTREVNGVRLLASTLMTIGNARARPKRQDKRRKQEKHDVWVSTTNANTNRSRLKRLGLRHWL